MTLQQVADELAEYSPKVQEQCGRCNKTYSIIRDGKVNWDCPYCGFHLEYQTLLDILQYRREIRAAETPPEADPVDSAPAPSLDDVIGNSAAVMQIRTALDAHRCRLAQGKTTAFPHTLLVGPAGSGKSTLAGIIAHECKHKMHEHLGQSLNDPRAMVAALMALKAGDVFFLEEIHGLKKTCTETLYSAMQDRKVSPIAARGVAPLPPVRLPSFTLIGATTDQYRLSDSFKQRFQYHLILRRMAVAELSLAISQRAERSGVKLDAPAATMIAERSHGTPRKAVMLLACCVDTALAGNSDFIDTMVVQSACEMAELDRLGLTSDARTYLRVIGDSVKPVRLNVLASTLAAPPRVVEVEIERDLIYLHLIEKRPDGRILTDAGREHIEKENRRSVNHANKMPILQNEI